MSYTHTAGGWESYEAVTKTLKSLGITYQEKLRDKVLSRGHAGSQNLRVATFTAPNGKVMVAEEYLAVDDGDCDGQSRVDVSVFEQGNRPQLATHVINGGMAWYGEINQMDGELAAEFYSYIDQPSDSLPQAERLAR